jgi:hypothetical protein
MAQLMETIGGAQAGTPSSKYENLHSFSIDISDISTCRRKGFVLKSSLVKEKIAKDSN